MNGVGRSRWIRSSLAFITSWMQMLTRYCRGLFFFCMFVWTKSEHLPNIKTRQLFGPNMGCNIFMFLKILKVIFSYAFCFSFECKEFSSEPKNQTWIFEISIKAQSFKLKLWLKWSTKTTPPGFSWFFLDFHIKSGFSWFFKICSSKKLDISWKNRRTGSLSTAKKLEMFVCVSDFLTSFDCERLGERDCNTNERKNTTVTNTFIRFRCCTVEKTINYWLKEIYHMSDCIGTFLHCLTLDLLSRLYESANRYLTMWVIQRFKLLQHKNLQTNYHNYPILFDLL